MHDINYVPFFNVFLETQRVNLQNAFYDEDSREHVIRIPQKHAHFLKRTTVRKGREVIKTKIRKYWSIYREGRRSRKQERGRKSSGGGGGGEGIHIQ